MEHRINGLSIVALVLIVLGIFTVLADRDQPVGTQAAAVESMLSQDTATNTPFQPLPTQEPAPVDIEVVETLPEVEDDSPDRPEDIRLPYDNYVLTQSAHGAAYGDAAIDLSAGRGVDILSPISGQVVLNSRDYYGNTILVIENEVWSVKMLHGEYYPAEEEWVGIGQMVGSESNIGYTVDIYGNSCRGRPCGNHTHLNVVDRRTGQNANLIELLQP